MASLLCLVAGAVLQAQECLKGPVTVGSLTIECSIIDNSGVGGGSDFQSIPAAKLLQVRGVSSDPDVIGLRIGLTVQTTHPTSDPQNPNIVTETTWALANKTRGSNPVFRYTFWLGGNMDDKFDPYPTSITKIEVQELKVSSSHVLP